MSVSLISMWNCRSCRKSQRNRYFNAGFEKLNTYDSLEFKQQEISQPGQTVGRIG